MIVIATQGTSSQDCGRLATVFLFWRSVSGREGADVMSTEVGPGLESVPRYQKGEAIAKGMQRQKNRKPAFLGILDMPEG